ncbi:MAG: beta-lactamase family protein, partial [Deltaproteobacteria bacterium]|nr:beta-lactamase family protein [Deltaproteobacteria bacterium]
MIDGDKGDRLEGRLSAFLGDAVKQKVFPGCVLAHGHPARGEVKYLWAGQRGITRDRLPVHRELVYDLASLTKILATTYLSMMAVGEGRLGLGSELGSVLALAGEADRGHGRDPGHGGGPDNWGERAAGLTLPEVAKGLRIGHLMAHRSGLPAWRPYFLDDGLKDRRRLIETILNEPRVAKIGEKTLYSDLNFILLGFVLEAIYQKDLKSLFAEKIAQPLGLTATGYRPDPLKIPVAPTEDGPRLGGPLNWPGAKVLGPVPLGRVHDDNAAFLGGQAGHAGLFGAAP